MIRGNQQNQFVANLLINERVEMKKFIFAILCFIYYVSAFSGEIPRLHVFHINGVNTTKLEAEANMKKLEETASIKSNFLVSSYSVGHFDLIYNQTHGAFLDIAWDTLGKKFKEGQSISLDDYVHAYMEKHPDKKVPDGSPEYNKLKQDIEADYKNMYFSQTNFDAVLKQFHNKVPPQFAHVVAYLKSFKSIDDKYNYSKDSADGVMLLPHSQGNLYANDLEQWLEKNEAFSQMNVFIFGIASPATVVGDGDEGGVLQTISGLKNPNLPLDPYYTADDDGVINLLRLFTLLPGTKAPMKANTHLTGCGDSMCHSLIKAYLNDAASKKHIQYMITVNINLLLNGFISDIADKETGSIEYNFDGVDTSHMVIKNSKGDIIVSNNMPNVDYLTYYRPSIDTGQESGFSDIYFDINKLPADTYTVYVNLKYNCQTQDSRDPNFGFDFFSDDAEKEKIKQFITYRPICIDGVCKKNMEVEDRSPISCNNFFGDMSNLKLIQEQLPDLFDATNKDLAVYYKVEVN
jgi:hypothetical protein